MRHHLDSKIGGSERADGGRWHWRCLAELPTVVAIVCCALMLSIVPRTAHAVIDTDGDVLLRNPGGGTFYGDNPFLDNDFLPDNGNFIDPARDPLDGFEQITFEGRPSNNGTPTDPFDDININFDVYVGRSSFGELIISGRSELRDMDLVIGDSAVINGLPRRGSGIVRIDGFSSLYNNDPRIIPYLGPILTPDPDNPVSPSESPRDDEPGFDMGFDLYVGRAGNGVLELIAGGRAEIHDAVIVGDATGSVGTLTIDGIDSFLQSGGLLAPTAATDEVHYMIVGRLGSATMSITNGGQSFNLGPVGTSAGDDIFAAVIGSNFAAVNTAAPGTGGQGTVLVDGLASKWTLGGTLQVGGFHDSRDSAGPSGDVDLAGNDAVYSSGVGRGTLQINNGALVSVVVPPLMDPTDPSPDLPDQLDLKIGHFGRVELNGGRFELLGAFDSTNPDNPTQQLQRGRIINDGVISGDGSMSALQFRNRVLGEVRVDAGQKLLIEATGSYEEIDNIPLPGEEEYPLTNYGVVKVLGTETARAEIEFGRNSVAPVDVTPTNFTRPFLNLPVTGPAAANDRTEGLIHAEYATMRFESGLWNRGVLAFTQGNNVVSGDVISFGDSMPGADDHGRVLLGPDTNVAFEDDFISLGTTQISPGATFQVLKGNSLALGGLTQMTIPGGPFGFNFTPNQVSGNASFGGILELTITNGGLLPPLSSIPLFNVGGTILSNFADVIVFGSPLEFFTAVQGSNLILQAFDPALAVGADFNGDGYVDALDYAIWRQNYGTGGPVGDANGDGFVDAADYTVWRNTFSPPPGSGGGGLAGGAVPEPTSFAMLLAGGLLALALQRRRSA